MKVTPLLALLAILLGNCLALSGCTQAFVEVRHDRAARNAPPDTVFSVGARWFFWDAYGDWLAGRVRGSK